MSAIKDELIRIASFYVNDFKNNPDQTLTMFCNTLIPLEIVNSVYGYLVNEKLLTKIEDLEEDMKHKLWEQSKHTCPTGGKEKIIKMCKCIWLMNYILEN